MSGWEGRGGRRDSSPRRMKYGGFEEDSPMDDFDRRDRGPRDREWKRRGGPLDISPPHKKRRDSRYGDYERDDYDRDYRRSSDRRSHSEEREDRERRTERRLFDGPVLPIRRFALEIRGEDLPPAELEKKYDEYVGEHQSRSAKRFFETHQNDEWFKERYHPDYVKELLEERTAYCKKQAELFPRLLEEGKVDVNLDHNPNGPRGERGDEKKTEGVEQDVKMGGEEEDSADQDEAEGSGEGVSDSGEGGKEEETDQDNEKEVEKEEEEEDSIAEEEHSDGDNDGHGDVSMEGPKSKSKSSGKSSRKKNTVFVRSIPVTVSRKALLDILDTVEHPLEYLILAQPRHTNFERVAWAHYENEGIATKACEAVNGVELGDYRVSAQLKMERGVFRKVAPPATASEERIKHDSEKALLLAKQMDKEKNIASEPLSQLLEKNTSGVRERLDLAIAYLRKVHLFCYYCGEGFADLDAMRDRCGTIHVRAPKLNSDREPDAHEKEWLESLDKRNSLRIDDPPNLDLPSSEELIEKAVEAFLEKNTKGEGDDKFRCGISYCAKLFCGKEFVTKHLNFKHADELDAIKDKVVEEAILQNLKEDPPRPKAPPVAVRPPPPPGPFPPSPFGHGRGFMGPPPGFGGPAFPFGRSPNQRGPPMGPPPGMAPDPRQVRQYIDLDAPVEAVPEIDYRASVTYDDI